MAIGTQHRNDATASRANARIGRQVEHPVGLSAPSPVAVLMSGVAGGGSQDQGGERHDQQRHQHPKPTMVCRQP